MRKIYIKPEVKTEKIFVEQMLAYSPVGPGDVPIIDGVDAESGDLMTREFEHEEDILPDDIW